MALVTKRHCEIKRISSFMGLDETERETARTWTRNTSRPGILYSFCRSEITAFASPFICAVRGGEENCRLVAQAPIGSTTERQTLRFLSARNDRN